MRLKSRGAWDEFLTRNYSKLLFTARKWTAEPRDLVHHTYLRCIDKRFPSDEDENPLGYFIKAMYNEATTRTIQNDISDYRCYPRRKRNRKRLDESHPTRTDAAYPRPPQLVR